MKKYFDLLVESQRLFQFSSKVQIFKLVMGDMLVGICEIIGFLPLFLLVMVMSSPTETMQRPKVALVLNYFSISSPLALLAILSLLVAAIFIFKAFLQVLYHYRVSRVSALWGNVISQKIFLNYFQADYTLLLKKSLTHMRLMMSYGHNVPNSFFVNFVLLFSYGAQVALLLIFMAFMLGWSALMVVAVGGCAFLFNRYYIKDKLVRMEEDIVKRTVTRSFIEQKTIDNIKEAKLSGKEDIYVRQYNEIIYPDASDKARIAFLGFLPGQFNEIITLLLMIVVFNLLQLVSKDNSFLTAQIGVMVGVVFRLLPYINRIMFSWNQLKSVSGIVRQLLDEYKEVHKYRSVAPTHSLPINFNQAIEFNNVSFAYNKKEKPVIDDFNLKINKGDFIGLTGPSGSGKTTLVNLLIGFMMPKKGDVKIDDVNLTRAHIRAWHKKIGLVDQNIFIALGTVAENVAYGEELSVIKKSKEMQGRIIAALKKAQIWDFVAKTPKGIFTKIGEGEKLLSGGQAQRIAIARAFYRDIELLILDEASAKLDMLTEKTFFDYLETLKGQITVVMIAHRLSTLKGCDNIIFMKDGKIKNSGSFKELEDKDDEFRLYLQQSRI
ncbi:MAG: ABC transporter ATP-binding protein [Hydrotalea sp.]|nr:ABC transporter ATP-binding protein [Hydrotalea sp.]